MRVYHLFDNKTVMAHILTKDTFDRFLISEIKISGKASFHLTGRAAEGFFSENELDETGYVSYGQVRQVCFEMMKGHKVPESFTFMFLLPSKELEKFLDETDSTLQPFDVENLSFLVRFKDGELTLTTGSAFKIFTMDQSLNVAWDSWVNDFLHRMGFQYDVM